MGKPTRSPLLGYNHNVKYRGRIFHIQTEDSGPANPHIFTHLFYEGTILASKRHVYDPTSPEDAVRALMQGQHKGLLKELKQAAHDDRIARFFAARGEVFEPAFVETLAETAAEHRALDLDAAPVATPTPPPEPIPPALPETPYVPPLETPGAAAAYAAAAPELDPYGAVPESVPDPTTEPYPSAPPVAPDELPGLPEVPPPEPPGRPVGPGVYTGRGTRERPFEGPAYPSYPTQRPTPPPSRSPTPPVVVIPPAPRRRPLRPASPMTPVVVQRTIAVGETKPNATPTPGQPVAPRPRRPAQAIPYVVREGSHPLTHRAVDSPPARPLAPPPAGAAPRTAARRPDARPPVEVVADKSLDEVILAYLAHEGGSSDSGENR